MALEQKITATIKKYLPEVVAVYLFGSVATALENQESDIDIAVLSQKKLNIEQRLELISELVAALHHDKIDLVDLNHAPTVLKFQIIMNERKIFCSNRHKSEFFEMCVFSDYVRLNEERREIIAAIKERGSVF
jgi:predicted nucleotidyltransferase